jgi:hypothetical protein
MIDEAGTPTCRSMFFGQSMSVLSASTGFAFLDLLLQIVAALPD